MGSAILQTNFTISLEDRLNALIMGPPAYMRRKRHIEDLEDFIARGLVLLERGEVERPEAFRSRLERMLVKANELIALHNRYYPSEANLPIDPSTGSLLEKGAPWSPLPRITFDILRARAIR